MRYMLGLLGITWGIICFCLKIPGALHQTLAARWMDTHCRRLLDDDTAPVILRKIEEGRVSQADLADIMVLRYWVANHFALLVKTLQQRATTLDPCTQCGLMNTLSINYREEVGVVGYDTGVAEPHAIWRARLLHSLGARTWRSIDSLTAFRLVNQYFELIDRGNILAAGGAMFYYEWRTAAIDYPRLIKGFEQIYADNPTFSCRPIDQRHPLWHLVAHAEHDKDHAWDLWTALLHSVKTLRQARATLAGVRYAQKLWKEFWNTVERDVLGPF